MDRRVVLPAVLAVHLAVAALHGSTHGLVPVELAPWQNAAVLVLVFAGPIVGVVLARRDHPLGAALFTATMAGGLLFGVYFHFLVENPDHVHAVPAGPWRLPFGVSAAGVALTGLLGTAVGAQYWRAQERGGDVP